MTLFTAAGCGGAGKKKIADMTVQKGTFEIIIPGFGELQAVKSTPIQVPTQVRGRQTLAWMAPENSIVKKGDTVIRLDETQYNDRIRVEEYNIMKLNLEIADKQRQMNKEKSELKGELNITAIEKDVADIYAARDESIFSRNRIIEDAINLDYLKLKSRHYERKKSKLDKKAQAELQLLELKRRTHRVKLDQYKAALDSLEIKAPHDGLFIYEKNWRGEKPRIGMSIWSGRKLGKLPDLSVMEAKVYILESEAAGLKKDLPVSIILDSEPETVFKGKVATIDTIAKPIERESPLKYFQIKVSLEKTDPRIMKPGNQVKSTVFVRKLENVISIPNQALFFEQNNGSELAFVNVKNGSGKEKRPVKIGDRSLTRTVITEGLSEGDIILLGNPGEQ
jgi:multidrug efflux pump subunit AcrA (membrane-fusion protein)